MQPAQFFSKLFGVNSGPRSFARAGLGAAAVRAGAIIASLAASTILARALGPTGFGIYANILAVLAIFALPVSMGLPTLILRETAAAQATQDYARMRGILDWSARLIFVTSALMLTLGFLILWNIGDRLLPGTKLTVVFGLLLIPITALGRARGAALKGLRQIVRGQFPDDVLRPAVLALLAAALVWGLGGLLTPARAMGLHLAAASVAFLLGYWLLLRAQPGQMATAKPQYQTAAWRKAILPLATISGLQIVSQQTDLIMLGIWRAPAEIGFYKVAVSGAALTTFGLTVLNMVLAPQFAKLKATGNDEELSRLAAKGAVLSLLFTLPMVLLFAVFGTEILVLLYGQAYADSAVPLVIISGGLALTASLGMTGIFISMTGLERFGAMAWFIAALTNVVLNAIVIPRFGMNGAAVATVISTFLASSFMWVAIYRKTGINVSALGIFRRRPKSE
ncbi:MAG: polysaccharide biosynthesis C-terminal domain-containing protein [Rhodobacteraceae bacterium]|nr:polysaccharide biosynthesis C-terminal domain-containing protein [Paracoccaceae bacterium]PHR62288.1 MAG: flippase [Robiginitomaculum sp.]